MGDVCWQRAGGGGGVGGRARGGRTGRQIPVRAVQEDGHCGGGGPGIRRQVRTSILFILW